MTLTTLIIGTCCATFLGCDVEIFLGFIAACVVVGAILAKAP